MEFWVVDSNSLTLTQPSGVAVAAEASRGWHLAVAASSYQSFHCLSCRTVCEKTDLLKREWNCVPRGSAQVDASNIGRSLVARLKKEGAG
jgi:hypothetical protein